MENSTVTCYGKHSDAYDIYQPAVVPYYQDMLQIVAFTVARNLGGKKETLKILDLGCGTGNASAAVLRTLPVKVFLLDGSGSMVEAANDKISKSWPDAIIGKKAADISSDDWDIDLVQGGYDAIISTLVLEHLPLDRYRIAIDKCFNLLKHGGWLIAVEGYEENG
jgi:SAM-dependent methyltransferase